MQHVIILKLRHHSSFSLILASWRLLQVANSQGTWLLAFAVNRSSNVQDDLFQWINYCHSNCLSKSSSGSIVCLQFMFDTNHPSTSNNTILQEKLHKKMMSLLATKMRPPTKKAFHRTVMSWLGKWTWDHQRSVCHLPIVLIWDVTSKSLCLHSDLRASVLVPAVYLISRPWRLRAFQNESPSPRYDWR